MTTAALDTKGRIILPKIIRRELDLGKGDRVGFERTSTGWVLLREPPMPMQSDGMAAKFLKKRRPMSVEEMKGNGAREAGLAFLRRR